MKLQVSKSHHKFSLSGAPGDWDEDYPVGCTIWKEGDTYMMWYTAGRKPPEDAHLPGFAGVQWGWGLAFSKDLRSWEKHDGNPVFRSGPLGSWDSGCIRAETMIKLGDTFYLWYHGEASRIGISMGCASSKDGIHWDKHPENPVLKRAPGEWDAEVAGDGSVTVMDGKFYLYYNGYGPYDNGRHHRGERHHRIGLAVSEDGVHFTKHPQNPLLDVGEPGCWDGEEILFPKVIRVKDQYLMTYSGRSRPWHEIAESEGDGMCQGFALSEDGIHWRRCENNPLIKPDPNGTWDRDSVCNADVFVDTDGSIYLVFATVLVRLEVEL